MLDWKSLLYFPKSTKLIYSYQTTSVIGILIIRRSIVFTVTMVPNKASSNVIVATIIKLSSSLPNVSCGISSVTKITSAEMQTFYY